MDLLSFLLLVSQLPVFYVADRFSDLPSPAHRRSPRMIHTIGFTLCLPSVGSCLLEKFAWLLTFVSYGVGILFSPRPLLYMDVFLNLSDAELGERKCIEAGAAEAFLPSDKNVSDLQLKL